MSHPLEFRFPRFTHLGDLPIEDFLRDYWQKKPLLIRQAFPDFTSLISPDELAGFALEEDCTSRLIVETPETNQWQVEHGPLQEDTFSLLQEHHWTLLVQHADSLDPRLNGLLNAFRFIPNWRLDDIMVSYATDGGGVGPHFDYFDVFLLQAEGQRRWRLGQRCDKHSPLQPDIPMQLLADFQTEEDWVVEPGDLLYIPACKAHWGEAIGECMTYSIGFRAPSHAEIALDLAQEFASYCSEDQRYHDPALSLPTHPGEIAPQAVEQMKSILSSLYSDEEKLKHWMGQYTTQLKQDIQCMLVPIEPHDIAEQPLTLAPFCRVAYTTHQEKTTCYINGESAECSLELAICLSEYRSFQFQDFSSSQDQALIRSLIEQACIGYSEDYRDV